MAYDWLQTVWEYKYVFIGYCPSLPQKFIQSDHVIQITSKVSSLVFFPHCNQLLTHMHSKQGNYKIKFPNYELQILKKKVIHSIHIFECLWVLLPVLGIKLQEVDSL